MANASIKPITTVVRSMSGRKMGYESTIGEIWAAGTVKNEVEQECVNAAMNAMSGHYTPYLVRFRNSWRVIGRTLLGWAVYCPHDGGGTADYLRPCGSTHPTLAKAAKEAMYNLCQLEWTIQDGVATGFPVSTDMLGEFASWCQWQLRYHSAKQAGMSDDDAHGYAGRNPVKPELWLNKELPPPTEATPVRTE